ncbi:expressed unknown protein [Seminavis robusta]|uniref:G-protein coupled receptors family 1 profile domain-containing protein n=1 Tax=Seminavis robusta TaxID=568900 RepID=A0A9N8DIU5_9STRA|nr:expressed unknown protein [Seminavis robusta]|eukprot:Sro144_g066990.1 n/a (987) ;mRNA; f:49238-52448
MNRHRARLFQSWQLAVLLALFGRVCIQVVSSQRVKNGCFDDNPQAFECVSYGMESVPEFLISVDMTEAEEGCLHLALNVFKSREIYIDHTKHKNYLNNITAKDPYCGLIQRAYRHCTFCVEDAELTLYIQNFCYNAASNHPCGLPYQKTREELLNDSDDLVAGVFRTEADIDDTCQAITTHLSDSGHGNLITVGMLWSPLSVVFCWRLFMAAHLCPGNCPGGCFTEEHPPTCDAEYDEAETNEILLSIQNQSNASLDLSSTVIEREQNRTVDHVCEDIRAWTFTGWSVYRILNNSEHLGILNAIDGPSPFCDEARLAYPHCIWCKLDDLCFGEDDPILSCELSPSSVSSPFQDKDLHPNLCTDMTQSIFQRDNADDNDDDKNEIWETYTLAIKNGSRFCQQARRAFPSCYWCAPHDLGKDLSELCFSDGNFCGLRDQIDIPDEFLSDLAMDPSLSPVVYGLMTAENTSNYCERFNSIFIRWQEFHSPDNYAYWGCLQKILLAKHCPEQICPEPPTDPYSIKYLGAGTTAEKRALIWASRIAACFSLCGAIYVLYDSLSDPRARKTVYHQLLAGMSSFDLMTAISWAFATAPINDNRIEGAIGNDATCTAQGFFIQLGFTSIFYAMSLAFYYFLVIACGWKEFQLQRILLFLHGVPLLVGFTLAFAAIPEYDLIVYVCHLTPHSDGEGKLWAALVFMMIPLSIAIVSITACMILVYNSVRRRAGASRKYSFGIGNASKLQQAVFWQALFYVGAFYVTWPTMFSVYLASVEENGPLRASLLIAFLAPLQGALNALVYARPKILQYYDERTKKRAQRHQQQLQQQQQQPQPQTIASKFLSVVIYASPFTLNSTRGDDDNANSDTAAPSRQRMRSVDPSVAVASERDVDSVMEDYLAHTEQKVSAPRMESIAESLAGEDEQGLTLVLSPNSEVEPEAAIHNGSNDCFHLEKPFQRDVPASSKDAQRPPCERNSTCVDENEGQTQRTDGEN